MFTRILVICLMIIFASTPASAEETQWFAGTLDNDIFLGNDNGYTNGVYFSWLKVRTENQLQKPNWTTSPLNWSLALEGSNTSLQAYTFGQTMVTPEDIRLENPPINDIPYSGSLLLHSTFIAVHDSYADAVGTAIGLVGPSSGAESTQKWVHKTIGADEPKGWDTQLGDELIFQLSRARLWRTWHSEDDRSDFLTLADAGVGTLGSYLAGGMILRYGRDLHDTFETPLLINTRTTNPAAVDDGWYAFAGARIEYTFNSIYADGNTFKNSRSVDYDRAQIGLMVGLALSFKQLSVTLAVYESNIMDSLTSDLTRFGTLTLGWRLR